MRSDLRRTLPYCRTMSPLPGSLQASTFFTIVGSQDPQVTPGQEQGPALDLLDAMIASGEEITEVILAWTPGATNRMWPGGYDEQLRAMRNAVRSRLPEAKVSSVPLGVKPNAAAEMLPVLAQALTRFRHGGRLLANTSSGTPQMLEALKLLRGTGWFAGGDVRLLQLDRPEFRQDGQPFWREATTPFLEETLKLEAAFAATRRFDFAGARDAFSALGAGPLELPGRALTVQALATVADALWWLDACNARDSSETLESLTLHISPLSELNTFLQEAVRQEADVLIWLTWGRFDRAAAQERTADALVWAVVLHELLVVKLAEQMGLPDTENPVRVQDLPVGLFDTLKAELPPESIDNRGNLKFMTLKDKLALLRAPVLKTPNVDVFDATRNASLETVRRWRNLTIHQGRVPDEVDLNSVDEVVAELLQAYPFQSEWGRQWAKTPHKAVISASSLQSLIDELQSWAG